MSVSLDIPKNRERFLRIVAGALKTNRLTEWEARFILDMKRWYDNREEIGEFAGTDPWSPTVKQWNQLTEIERKL